MRLRIWAFIALALLLIATACTDGRISRGPASTPVPTKTLRPTFTSTPAKPTLTPTPAPPTATATSEAPTAIPEPPTPEPTSTPLPAQAAFTVTSATLNVRSGPGTNYGAIGQLRQGQTYPITGKNRTGDWWQFDYNGRAGWVSGPLVRATGTEGVQVAANIPPAPTAAPRPTARPTTRPQPQQPAQPPAAAKQFAQAGAGEFRNAANTSFDWVTFWGRLGKTTDASPITGFRLRVSAASGTKEQPFNAVWEIAYSGITGSEFLYNAKVELPRTAGGFTAVVIDGSGAEVSDPISGTLLDRTHDVILNWIRR